MLKDNNNNNIKIIQCSSCEADDIIGQLSIYIENKWKINNKKIYILANDYDYLQVCNENIILINGIGNIISNKKEKTILGESYLLSKILLGDKSDNINACTIDSGFLNTGICSTKYKNINKKIINDIFNNLDKYNVLIKLLNDIRNNKLINEIENKNIININKFKHNCNMIDFKMLPHKLNIKLYKLFDEII